MFIVKDYDINMKLLVNLWKTLHDYFHDPAFKELYPGIHTWRPIIVKQLVLGLERYPSPRLLGDDSIILMVAATT